MSNRFYDKGLEKFAGPATGQVNWTNDAIKVAVVDVAQYGIAINGATNATSIVIQTTANHSMASGDSAMVVGVVGNTAANGSWTVTVIDATHFSLDDSQGNGAYESGGFLVKLSSDEFLSDIPVGARLAISPALSGKQITRGWLIASPVTVLGVTGPTAELLVGFKDTGVAATSPLLFVINTATDVLLTPSGSDVLIDWDQGNSDKVARI